MIVVDTSALICVVLEEPQAEACRKVLATPDRLLMSAATFTESLIVAGRRGEADRLRRLIYDLDVEIVDVTPESAQRAAEAYRRWGKGVHPAGLNFGDCFAYELAQRHGCPLLFIGGDFGKTDIAPAIA